MARNLCLGLHVGHAGMGLVSWYPSWVGSGPRAAPTYEVGAARNRKALAAFHKESLFFQSWWYRICRGFEFTKSFDTPLSHEAAQHLKSSSGRLCTGTDLKDYLLPSGIKENMHEWYSPSISSCREVSVKRLQVKRFVWGQVWRFDLEYTKINERLYLGLSELWFFIQIIY